jgi:cytochrome c-type biogenesis protein CcmH
MRWLLVALIFGSLSVSAAHAVLPDEMLKDPVLEARARALSAELRCLVCQNQSIDDSDADLAHDLRVLLRERIAAGDSDQEVIDFLVARYGEFILLKPPFAMHTLLLWLIPPGVLLIGALAALWGWRRRRNQPAESEPLDAAETASLRRILTEEGRNPG